VTPDKHAVDSARLRWGLRVLEVLALSGLAVSVVLLLLYHARVPERFVSAYDSAGNPQKWEKRGATDTYPVVSVVFYGLAFLPQTLYFIYRKKRPPVNQEDVRETNSNRVLFALLKVEMVWYSVYLEWHKLRVAVGETVSRSGRADWYIMMALMGTALVLIIFNMLPKGASFDGKAEKG